MLLYDNLTKSFHKHLYEHINSSYFCYFSKLNLGQDFMEKLWIQPIWADVPLYPYCPNMIKVTLRCQSIIAEDPLLTNLRKMVDLCLTTYSKNFRNPTTTNIVPIYSWDGSVLADTEPIGYVETIVRSLYEVPVAKNDTVGVVNIPVTMLICCWAQP